MEYTIDNIVGIKFKCKDYMPKLTYEISRITKSDTDCIVVSWYDLIDREAIHTVEDAIRFLNDGIWIPQ